MKIFVSLILMLSVQVSHAQSTPLEIWLSQEVELSKAKIIESMSYPDLTPGAIIASPSKANPDYYYHWVRDAGFIADVLVDLYLRSTSSSEKYVYETKIKDFISFSRLNQNTQTLTGYGEPKFYVDGKSYELPWGRPQNDGPAIRALAIIKWAYVLIDEGKIGEVRKDLYVNEMPARSVIKSDLEYVALNWSKPSFDLWEELSGDHFFTLMVQKSALQAGARLAQILGDFGASDWYLKESQKIEASLKRFLNKSALYIPTTLNYQFGLNTKVSNLDTAVILALLRAPHPKNYLSWTDSRVQKTIDALILAFKNLYNINKFSDAPGVAIGRYTEDTYDGADSKAGNPWVLTTLAIAEAYYETAAVQSDKSKAEALIAKGDEFVKRVQFHANPDGSLSEQMNRDNGYMVSAHNLTWNYAAILTANWARERALAK